MVREMPGQRVSRGVNPLSQAELAIGHGDSLRHRVATASPDPDDLSFIRQIANAHSHGNPDPSALRYEYNHHTLELNRLLLPEVHV